MHIVDEHVMILREESGWTNAGVSLLATTFALKLSFLGAGRALALEGVKARPVPVDVLVGSFILAWFPIAFGAGDVEG